MLTAVVASLALTIGSIGTASRSVLLGGSDDSQQSDAGHGKDRRSTTPPRPPSSPRSSSSPTQPVPASAGSNGQTPIELTGGLGGDEEVDEVLNEVVPALLDMLAQAVPAHHVDGGDVVVVDGNSEAGDFTAEYELDADGGVLGVHALFRDVEPDIDYELEIVDGELQSFSAHGPGGAMAQIEPTSPLSFDVAPPPHICNGFMCGLEGVVERLAGDVWGAVKTMGRLIAEIPEFLLGDALWAVGTMNNSVTGGPVPEAPEFAPTLRPFVEEAWRTPVLMVEGVGDEIRGVRDARDTRERMDHLTGAVVGAADIAFIAKGAASGARRVVGVADDVAQASATSATRAAVDDVAMATRRSPVDELAAARAATDAPAFRRIRSPDDIAVYLRSPRAQDTVEVLWMPEAGVEGHLAIRVGDELLHMTERGILIEPFDTTMARYIASNGDTYGFAIPADRVAQQRVYDYFVRQQELGRPFDFLRNNCSLNACGGLQAGEIASFNRLTSGDPLFAAHTVNRMAGVSHRTLYSNAFRPTPAVGLHHFTGYRTGYLVGAVAAVEAIAVGTEIVADQATSDEDD